ncbi:MAG: GFA family protein [Moraxellaceae bacterium]|nr:MAG: GFA family protein [Moraxellaceae bacterium]
MLKGHCLCQGVQYEYQGEIDEVAMCHCHQCKQAQGTPFATNAPVQLSAFHIVQGQALLKSYFASPNKRRVFCSNCASPLFSQRMDMPEVIRLRLGTVKEGHIPAPAYEIFCDSRSPWLETNVDRPCYPANKP